MKKKHAVDDNIIREILNQVDTPEYDISAGVLERLNDKLYAGRNIIKPARILAVAAAVLLIIGLFNIQTVIAFVRGIFIVPGVGFTDGEISVVMLTEPVIFDMGVILEFATKIKNNNNKDDDGECEILLFFSSREPGLLRSDGEISAVIDGGIYNFNSQTVGERTSDFDIYFGSLTAVSENFPDVNEFDLIFKGETARVILTELSDEEKMPYLSKENNGIRLAAYKFRGTNRLIGFDMINNNSLGEFNASVPEIYFESITGADGTSIKSVGGSEYAFRGWAANDPHRVFSYAISQLDNQANIELTALDDLPPLILVDYIPEIVGHADLNIITSPKLTLPIPADGESMQVDIKIPVGGIYYEVSEVKREGGTLYFKDNAVGYDENFDFEHAVATGGAYIAEMQPAHGYRQGEYSISEYNFINIFEPDADFIDINIRAVQVAYFGDFSIDLTQK